MLTQLEERLLWIALIALTVIGGGWYIVESLERRGAAKCQMDDAQVAAVQKAAAAAQEAKDAQRIKDAEDGLQTEVAENAKLRASLPTDHVMCIAPSPQRVRAAAVVSKAGPAATGVLPPERAPDPVTFDPGPKLDTLFDEADDILARCRELDAAVPHPVSTH